MLQICDRAVATGENDPRVGQHRDGLLTQAKTADRNEEDTMRQAPGPDAGRGCSAC
jgi:hypothetical protein